MGELAASPYPWMIVERGEPGQVDRIVVDCRDLPQDDTTERLSRMTIAREVAAGRVMLAPHWQEANDLRRRVFGVGAQPEVLIRG